MRNGEKETEMQEERLREEDGERQQEREREGEKEKRWGRDRIRWGRRQGKRLGGKGGRVTLRPPTVLPGASDPGDTLHALPPTETAGMAGAPSQCRPVWLPWMSHTSMCPASSCSRPLLWPPRAPKATATPSLPTLRLVGASLVTK